MCETISIYLVFCCCWTELNFLELYAALPIKRGQCWDLHHHVDWALQLSSILVLIFTKHSHLLSFGNGHCLWWAGLNILSSTMFPKEITGILKIIFIIEQLGGRNPKAESPLYLLRRCYVYNPGICTKIKGWPHWKSSWCGDNLLKLKYFSFGIMTRY